VDVLELLLLCIECVVIGFGMALGDWVLKLIAVKFLNSGQLHDVDAEPSEGEAEEDPPAKKAAKRGKTKPRTEPRGRSPSGSSFTF